MFANPGYCSPGHQNGGTKTRFAAENGDIVNDETSLSRTPDPPRVLCTADLCRTGCCAKSYRNSSSNNNFNASSKPRSSFFALRLKTHPMIAIAHEPVTLIGEQLQICWICLQALSLNRLRLAGLNVLHVPLPCLNPRHKNAKATLLEFLPGIACDVSSSSLCPSSKQRRCPAPVERSLRPPLCRAWSREQSVARCRGLSWPPCLASPAGTFSQPASPLSASPAGGGTHIAAK